MSQIPSKIAKEIVSVAKLLAAESFPIAMFKGIEKMLVQNGVGEASEWTAVPISPKAFSASGIVAGFQSGKPLWVAERPKGKVYLYVNKDGQFSAVYKEDYKDFASLKDVVSYLNYKGIPIGLVMAPSKIKMHTKRFEDVQEKNKVRETSIKTERFVQFIQKKLSNMGRAIAKQTEADIQAGFKELSEAIASRKYSTIHDVSYKIQKKLNNRYNAINSIADLAARAFDWDEKIIGTVPLSYAKNVSKSMDQALTGTSRWD